MTNDVLRIEPCGCQVVRNDDGNADKCGVHIKWCVLHGAAFALQLTVTLTLKSLDKIGGGGGFDLHDADRCRRELRDVLEFARGPYVDRTGVRVHTDNQKIK